MCIAWIRAARGGTFCQPPASEGIVTTAHTMPAPPPNLSRRLKLSELRTFLAVLEQRSFRRAAAVLHLTQPAVTRAIASLEHSLEARLFDRVARGVEPTPQGHAFAPHAAMVFDELRRAVHALARAAPADTCALRVGVAPPAATALLARALAALLHEHPDLRVAVVEEPEAVLLSRLRRGEIALALLRTPLSEPDAGLRCEPLLDDRLAVIAHPRHPLAARAQLRWDELTAHRWVAGPADCGFGQRVQRRLHAFDLSMPAHTVQAPSFELQLGMVLQAGLLAFALRSQLACAPAAAGVVALRYELPALQARLMVATLAAHAPGPLVQQLGARLRALAAAAPAVAPAVALRPRQARV